MFYQGDLLFEIVVRIVEKFRNTVIPGFIVFIVYVFVEYLYIPIIGIQALFMIICVIYWKKLLNMMTHIYFKEVRRFRNFVWLFYFYFFKRQKFLDNLVNRVVESVHFLKLQTIAQFLNRYSNI